MKSVLISIQRPHMDNIKALIKKIEIRKNKPNQETPFPCFIYETKTKGGCGKVIGEFVCDKVTEYIAYKTQKGSKLCKNPFFYACLPIQEMCLTIEQVEDYGKGKTLYGWHISDLKIYDEPKELREFKRWNRTEENAPCAHTKWLYPDCKDCKACNLTRPPQSWCYVESLGE